MNTDPNLVFVMPCKVGEYFWKIIFTRTTSGRPRPLHIRRTQLTLENFGMVAMACGKTAFSTRAEAEAELQRLKDKWEGSR